MVDMENVEHIITTHSTMKKNQYCNSIEGQKMEQWKMKWEGKVGKILKVFFFLISKHGIY